MGRDSTGSVTSGMQGGQQRDWWARFRRLPCRCAQAAPDAEPQTVVTLVHGTFARHASWMQPGSRLRATIDGEGVLVRCFCWSGRNRHRDRILAGYALKEQLRDQVIRFPGADHHVIAHSHGGNVALYALSDEDDQYLPEFTDVSLTTLATPFLNFRPTHLRWTSKLTLVLTLLMGLLGLLMAPAVALDSSDTVGSRIAVTTFYLLMVAALFAYPITAIMYMRARTWSRVKASIALLFGRGIDAELHRLRTARSSPKHLVVLGAGDEASDLLGAAQLASWLGHQLIDTTLKRSLAVGMVFGLIQMPWLYVDLAADDYLLWENIASMGFVLAFMTVMAPLYLPILRILVLVFIPWPGMAFGTDALFLSIHAITSVTVAPEGRADVLIAQPHGDLVHGLYENPAVLDAIRFRLGHELQRPPVPPAPPPFAPVQVGAPPAPPPPSSRLVSSGLSAV